MSTLKCDHCLSTISEGSAVRDEVGGRERVFCCNGCRGIYRLIRSEGLDGFYDRRTGWKPGPPEETEITPEPFLPFVKTSGSEAEIDINLSGIRCASCIWLIERFLGRSEGITHVALNYATHRARIRWLPEKTSIDLILKRILSLGYTPRPYSASAPEEEMKRERRDLLVRFGTASFLSMQLMLFTTALYAGYFQGIEASFKKIFEFIALAFATPVVFYCGRPFMKSAWRGIRNRTFNMDTLIFMGSFSAYAYSFVAIATGGEVYFDTAAMIVTLILLGRFIESGAKAKAAGAISSLISLQPREARLLRRGENGRESPVKVPVDSLEIGDRVEVLPGERIPTDCAVLEGTSEVDESMLTGESKPAKKSEGSEVIGGTVNLNGRIILRVLKTGNETALSRIIKAVEDAQARKAAIQTEADKIVGWFVPAVILVAAASFVFWLLRLGVPSQALMNAIAVLVISCPCALGLATPLAILIGSGLLSSRGILVKGGDIVEEVARTDFVSFDKTGTLTKGRPLVVNLLHYGISPRELRILAASIERGSEHTIAKAFRSGIDEEALHCMEHFRAHPGRGVEAMWEGRRVTAGNTSFLESAGVTFSRKQREDYLMLSSKGDTVIGLAVEGDLRGWFVLSDELKDEVPEVVTELRRLGQEVGLLTGDQKRVAEEIGGKAGITIIDSEVLPVEKADRIRRMKESGRTVMMVGDGINDAPALIEAHVGVAIGSATDIAMESADAVLIRNDLRLVPQLLEVSRKTLSVIRQNLFWAFSYNLIAIPLAVSGKIHPIISAAFMAISSLIVVGNSLRLNRLRRSEER